MHPLIEADLAGEWRFTPEGQAAATIQVPGGGWLKQGFDCEALFMNDGSAFPTQAGRRPPSEGPYPIIQMALRNLRE